MQMENKNYVICLKCGNVQVRTNIIAELFNKQYAFLDKKQICPKCHRESQFVATKNIKQLRKALVNSDNRTDQRISNCEGQIGYKLLGKPNYSFMQKTYSNMANKKI